MSSALVELSPTAAILVDVGEGTTGQLRVLYGPERLSQLLLRLHAVFITHSHQVREFILLFSVLKHSFDGSFLTGPRPWPEWRNNRTIGSIQKRWYI